MWEKHLSVLWWGSTPNTLLYEKLWTSAELGLKETMTVLRYPAE